MEEKITILDTLFRDGRQGKKMEISKKTALQTIKLISELGADIIEVGFAGSNGSANEIIKESLKLNLGQTKIAAFGRTRKAKERVSEAEDVRQIVNLGVPVAVIVAKSRLMDVKNSFKIHGDDNLRMIEDTVQYLKGLGIEIVLDLEHAVDAFYGRGSYGRFDLNLAETRNYFLDVVKIGIASGAKTITICDTNGGGSPEEVSKMISFLKDKFDGANFGIHAHNNNDMAVAVTRAAVFAGANHVQGVFGGYGERCGNANLFSIISRLQLKDGIKLVSEKSIASYTKASAQIAHAFKREASERAAFVGINAFTTFAGMHGDSEEKDEGAYLDLNPTAVGNKKRIGVNRNSGRSNIYSLAKRKGFKLKKEEIDLFLKKHLKDIEHGRFEASEESFVLACLELIEKTVLFFQVTVCRPSSVIDVLNGTESSVCSMGVMTEHSANIQMKWAEGEGQFDAMFKALQSCLINDFPGVSDIVLKSYSANAQEVEKEGTGAYVRVELDFAANGFTWTTAGVDRSSKYADMQALVDGFKWFIYKNYAQET